MKIFRSKIVIFAVCLLIAGCLFMGVSFVVGGPNLISNMVSAVITPVQRVMAVGGDMVGDFFGYFYKYNQLESENAALRAEVAKYRELEQSYYAAKNENTQLREMLALKLRRRDLTCEPCNIISEISGVRSTFTIDKGSLSGIEVGNAVMTNDGLVGYISSVGINYSEAITILDMTSKVGALVSRTRESAVAEGSYELMNDGNLKLSYLKNDSDVRMGDWVETSGYGEMYPKGILIGRVLEFAPEAHGISSYAIVEPVVKMDELRAVFVVTAFEIVE